MISITQNADLKKMTTFGLPAECGRLIQYSDPEKDLPELDREGLLDNAVILGGGSNMLFTSLNKALTVIHPINRNISCIRHNEAETSVTADAGISLDELCRFAAERNLWGLENLSGIPGHIGGAAVQNVGAYGTEFCDIADTVTCYSCKSHTFVSLKAQDCQYGYRDSIFKHKADDDKFIVCRVTLKLSETPSPVLKYKGLYDKLCQRYNLSESNSAEENILLLKRNGLTPTIVRETVISLRDSKLPDPEQTGSAGSFFKNPIVNRAAYSKLESIWSEIGNGSPLPNHFTTDGNIKLSAAWLIDKAECKPLTHGGAALWQSQPLVLVNQSGNATSEDIIQLEEAVIARVKEVFGITLHPEVIHI